MPSQHMGILGTLRQDQDGGCTLEGAGPQGPDADSARSTEELSKFLAKREGAETTEMESGYSFY